MTAANDDRQQLRAVLANAIQAARSGTTGTPPNVDGLTTDEALNIMGHGLIEADNLLRADEAKSSLPDYQVRDLELRLDAVRAQRDAAVQQSLDHAATIAVLRRRADTAEAWRRSSNNSQRLIARIKSGELGWNGTEWVKRAERIGYCDSTFTPPNGGDTLTCALDAGHATNLHHDAGNTWAWTTDGAQVVGMIPGGVR
ncbi:hypothetical protein [Gordonia sp. WA4-43]|uniref:hypothetical protein n=1 Tax=Gordonia sp. WA4-43 TaxID=2878678 RepID=UPI001CFA49C5|nr:hypothetical protein [Gordonia sp. WA4-43]UCZ88624.1 hypothetical protein LEL84_16260 [Gordonia sp. WA4-43]